MSYRTPLLDRSANLPVFSLISVLICTGASAQSPFAGGHYPNRPAIPSYAFSRSNGPYVPRYGAVPYSGGPPGASWQNQGVNAPFARGPYLNRPAMPGYTFPPSYRAYVAPSDG